MWKIVKLVRKVIRGVENLSEPSGRHTQAAPLLYNHPVEGRRRGVVESRVDLSFHHETQMPETLWAPLGSCQQLSPCKVTGSTD